ncbi:hypothetical protein [Salininema proteolyticum]|uniref:HNH endonuclease n=1 Tax=Salininema proteolyticum TaxID=1607685 RepID=A0ABV8TT12_9ACTN
MTNVTASLVDQLLRRDCRRCVSCGRAITGARGTDWDVHYRIPRKRASQNPLVRSMANLLIICGTGERGCCGEFQRNPRVARWRGLVLWDSQNPETVPVQVGVEPPDDTSSYVPLVVRPWRYSEAGFRTQVREEAGR